MQERIVRGNDYPWLIAKIKKNSENDWSNYCRCRNMVTTAIRISKARYNRDVLRENSNNSKKPLENNQAMLPYKIQWS